MVAVFLCVELAINVALKNGYQEQNAAATEWAAVVAT